MPDTEQYDPGLYYLDSGGTSWTMITPIIEYWDQVQSLNQVSKYSRDGTLHMQIIGSPRKQYKITCYAKKLKAWELEREWSKGTLIRFISQGRTGQGMEYGVIGYGRIVEYEKKPVNEKNNLMYDGKSWEEYYEIDITLNYENAPSNEVAVDTVSGGPAQSEN